MHKKDEWEDDILKNTMWAIFTWTLKKCLSEGKVETHQQLLWTCKGLDLDPMLYIFYMLLKILKSPQESDQISPERIDIEHCILDTEIDVI